MNIKYTFLFLYSIGLLMVNSTINQATFNAYPNQILNEIPALYKNYLSVNINEGHTITVKKTIQIKGQNKLLGNVYINGNLAKLDLQGNFSESIDLENTGKHVLVICFTTRENTFIAIQKNINYLEQANYKHLDSINKQKLTYLLNTDLYEHFKTKTLEDPITRKELAFVIATLRPKLEAVEIQNISDISKNDWYYLSVQSLVSQKIMGMYPNNYFYPDKNISNL
ncbi:S-layer homology domain-containing protein, partial [bacterium]|nr:S-layer homology domain-containing protein [bacterium]